MVGRWRSRRALVFYAAGAWPVVGFMALDAGLHLGRHDADDARRQVVQKVLTLWPSALELRKIDPRARKSW